VLHFATHFLSDDRQPLYSRIVLADEEVLQTYEIFDAALNAELAVLSACDTGLGKLAKGEGLIGISRAFLYAGVPSLVVSLWSVDDEATARIMERFYELLRSGVSRKQALRQAKLDYLSEAEGPRKDPFYWAPFILSGDWRPLALPAPAGPAWGVYAVLGLLIALAALVVWKRRRAPA
jgi:CHAT domain-containing protein